MKKYKGLIAFILLIAITVILIFALRDRGSGSYQLNTKNFNATIENQKDNLVTTFKTPNASAIFTLKDTKARKRTEGNTQIFEISKDLAFKYEPLKGSSIEGLKEIIVLKNKNAPNEFLFNLELTNIAGFEESNDNTWHFNNEQGQEIFSIPAHSMKDAKGAKSNLVRMEIRKIGPGYIAKIIADKKWLEDSARFYPVEIDPSIVLKRRVYDF